MSPAQRCQEPGCEGVLTPDGGYCLASGAPIAHGTGLHVLPRSVPVPEQTGISSGPQGPPPPALVELPDEDAGMALPRITLRDRASGSPQDPRALRALGLAPGERLAGKYRVVRELGYGGMGTVYLAHEEKIDEREVAIKFPRDHDWRTAEVDSSGRANLLGERKALVELSHDDIIRVYNYDHHPGHGDFLVLQYVDGLNLDQVRASAEIAPDHYGSERFHEFVLVYGVRVLSALAYLHGQGKVYADLKPFNLMHDGTATKIVDIGSVRAVHTKGVTTPEFTAPDVAGSGTDYQDDLYSLGETLRSLSGLGDLAALSELDDLRHRSAAAGALAGTTTPAPKGLGLVSLARVLRRATRTKRADRFADAQEMELQLRGVFRELRSLRTGMETFEPSPLFFQSPFALDGELGSPPPVSHWSEEHWTDAANVLDGARQHPLSAPPPPTDVAQRLPVPRPDRDDDNHHRIDRLSDGDPDALLQRVGNWEPSTELHLLCCRLELRVALQPVTGPEPGRQEEAEDHLARAQEELDRAKNLIGPELAPRDWRVDWHQGLLELARGQVRKARACFDRVYAAIPGEYAPKLALGYCWEHGPLDEKDPDGPDDKNKAGEGEDRGGHQVALILHEAVRLRNPSLGGAAFGAARALLRQAEDAGNARNGESGESGENSEYGDKAALRARAVEALEAVPRHSKHRTAARTAAVRITVRHAESAADLEEVLHRLDLLFTSHGLTDRQARLRMRTEVWERVFALLAGDGLTHQELARLHDAVDTRLEFPGDERQLRQDLAGFYEELARQAARSAGGSALGRNALAERLLDRAYAVRPIDRRHHRDIPWIGTRIWNRLSRTTATARTPGAPAPDPVPDPTPDPVPGQRRRPEQRPEPEPTPTANPAPPEPPRSGSGSN